MPDSSLGFGVTSRRTTTQPALHPSAPGHPCQCRYLFGFSRGLGSSNASRRHELFVKRLIELLHAAVCVLARLLRHALTHSRHAKTEPEDERLRSLVFRERRRQLQEVAFVGRIAGPEKPNRSKRCQPFQLTLLRQKVRHRRVLESEGLQLVSREQNVPHNLPLAPPFTGAQQVVRDIRVNPGVGDRQLARGFYAEQPSEESIANSAKQRRARYIPTRDGSPNGETLLLPHRSRPVR